MENFTDTLRNIKENNNTLKNEKSKLEKKIRQLEKKNNSKSTTSSDSSASSIASSNLSSSNFPNNNIPSSSKVSSCLDSCQAKTSSTIPSITKYPLNISTSSISNTPIYTEPLSNSIMNYTTSSVTNLTCSPTNSTNIVNRSFHRGSLVTQKPIFTSKQGCRKTKSSKILIFLLGFV